MRTAFGRLVIDTDTRQLLEGGKAVPLSPKAFDLLALLVDNRPRALSKDELHERLWPGTHVSDANLAGLVAEIRRAVGDDARTPRFVRTVQRFGYAFSGAASAEGPVAEIPPVAPSVFWLVDGKRQIPLIEGENVLGREPFAGSFTATSVSRRHARLTVVGERAYLEDLGSKNGTFLRGRRVETTQPVADGDTIELGSVALVFRGPELDRSTRTWRRDRRKSR
jgi:DNA-binding winged helix-turn-helix (wHTH) protein